MPASTVQRRTMYHTSLRDIRPGRAFWFFQAGGGNNGSLRFYLDAVGIEIGLELVMAGHFIDFAVFLGQAKPRAFLLGK
jgi:hypothetical protein